MRKKKRNYVLRTFLGLIIGWFGFNILTFLLASFKIMPKAVASLSLLFYGGGMGIILTILTLIAFLLITKKFNLKSMIGYLSIIFSIVTYILITFSIDLF